jgi:hypothetical protein
MIALFSMKFIAPPSAKKSVTRSSFGIPVRRKLAAQFYRRFFELAPDAEGLFRRDMERQHLKLMGGALGPPSRLNGLLTPGQSENVP